MHGRKANTEDNERRGRELNLRLHSNVEYDNGNRSEIRKIEMRRVRNLKQYNRIVYPCLSTVAAQANTKDGTMSKARLGNCSTIAIPKNTRSFNSFVSDAAKSLSRGSRGDSVTFLLHVHSISLTHLFFFPPSSRDTETERR